MVAALSKFMLNLQEGKPRNRLEDNIRMDLKAICVNTRNKVDLAQNRDY